MGHCVNTKFVFVVWMLLWPIHEKSIIFSSVVFSTDTVFSANFFNPGNVHDSLLIKSTLSKTKQITPTYNVFKNDQRYGAIKITIVFLPWFISKQVSAENERKFNE